MLSILIVDDEMPAIEAIRQRVDWEKMGITKVFVADSAQNARNLFTTEKIDMMLCDIEMPGESGLELLAWVNQFSLETVSIFLTCHADFSYARQAVHMGAFEYLLKPALIEDIEDVVGRAAAHYMKKKSQIETQRAWQHNKATVEQQIWLEIIKGHFSMTREALLEALEHRGMHINLDIDYLPMICSVRQWISAVEGREVESLEYAWLNLLSELFTFDQLQPIVLSEMTGKKILLVPFNKKISIPGIETQCKLFIKVLNEFFLGSANFYRGGACFYIGQFAPVKTLPKVYAQVLSMEEKNVAYDEQVFWLDGNTTEANEDMKPLLERWKSLMEGGRCKELCEAISVYLNEIVREKRMSRNFLQAFYHNFSQMVYAVLMQKDILAQQLLQNIEPTPENAQKSVEQMQVYTKNVIEQSMEYMNTVGHGNQIIKTVKNYIHEHIYEDISRDELAKFVYLNPNYLSRLFSHEMGTSLIDYVTSSKLTEVQKLLANASLSITEAASQVGYTNMPYFSRLYKKKFGMTPAEYRQKVFGK